MATFKETRLNLGDIKAKVATTVFFAFDEITKADVVDVTPTCGCTSVKILDDGIKATYVPAVGHGAKTITVTLNANKFGGFNDNGTPKNKLGLEFYGNIKP